MKTPVAEQAIKFEDSRLGFQGCATAATQLLLERQIASSIVTATRSIGYGILWAARSVGFLVSYAGTPEAHEFPLETHEGSLSKVATAIVAATNPSWLPNTAEAVHAMNNDKKQPQLGSKQKG